MGLTHEVVKLVGRALRPVHAGTEKLATSVLGRSENATIKVTSEAFHVGGAIPRDATADGEGTPPIIEWRRIPGEAKSLVVICEDPDAPFPRPFVHWLVYGIPAADGALDAALLEAVREGRNSMGTRGFTAAAPPAGHGLHHYHFQVFALDTELSLEPGAGRAALLDAMRGHVLAWGDLVGTYARN